VVRRALHVRCVPRLKCDSRLSEQLAVSTVICMPGRDCSIGGGTQQSSSAASSSLFVLIGARGL
jgi:hypothetical protein